MSSTAIIKYWAAACLSLLLLSLSGRSQGSDSLLQKINQAAEDSFKVQLLFQYGEQFETSQPDTALAYYERAKTLSEKLNYSQGLFTYCSYRIVILNNQGRFREALELCLQTARLFENSSNQDNLAALHINTGSEWQYLSDLETAARHYILAAELAEKTGNRKFMRVAYNNLASVFNSLQQYEKGKKYALRALEMARSLQNDYAVASSLINLATSESFLKAHDSSLHHFREVEKLGIRMEDDIIRMDGWLGIADNYKTIRKADEAETYYNRVVRLSQTIKAPEYELYGYIGLSDLLLKTGRHRAAQPFIEAGIPLALQLGTRLELKDLYLRASEMHEAAGRPVLALKYHRSFVALNDSLLNEKNSSAINLMEIRYETQKKAAQIQQLEAEREIQQLRLRQKNIFNYILLGSVLSILIIALIASRNYRQQRILQQQKISELEKEKQLLATEAVLKGQEEERSRLAKDLHDGLGGMLAGIKHSFSNMKEHLIMTPENLQDFQKSIDMLDLSITELRRVAHNMMPESLMKYGLDTALKDFCAGINKTGAIRVIYQSYNLADFKEPQTTVVTVYRIVQELLTNVMKHAAASQAIVQLNRDGNKLLLTVEDDGKGISQTELRDAAGIGWRNIRQRLDYLKGQYDIQTSSGKGTSVNIEIAI